MFLRLLALGVFAAATASATCTLTTSLAAAAARTGRLFGGCLATAHFNDAKYLQLGDRHFAIVTAENECKMEATEPQPGQFTFQGCDAILNHAKAHNMTFRGHTLVWHAQVAPWMEALKTPAEKKKAIINHINGVLAHYKGKAYAWDVVNEAVNDSATKLRSSVWYPDVPDFIDIAFRTARAADPKAKLFYNDYGADGLGAKSDYVYNMIKGMKQRGVPIDGVGFQMHLGTTWSPGNLLSNFQRFGALGLEIHITEVDVGCRNASEWGKQAQMYVDVAKACLAVPACKSFVVWGVVDQYSWRVAKTPLLFDSSYAPKPAACALRDTFVAAAPKTQLAEDDANGASLSVSVVASVFAAVVAFFL
eukprot:m51a1_g2220 putative endo- -beta-xylanase (363) ;mRNA; f:218813-219953